uniref:WH2 domain-containing protein n=1 Tax=Panagrolaimus sp. PS1159 TaxID=55785 RepID=A0AC35FG70_9BILA
MTQIDPQIAFQMHFQKLMHDIFSQTNSCIQEVNDYMYQLQMNLLLQSSQMPQQQQCTSYQMPQRQYVSMTPQSPQQCSYMPIQMAPQMIMMPPQQQQLQWQQQFQPQMKTSAVPTAVTPVVVQPPTPPPSVPKPIAPKVTITPPPPPSTEEVPIVKLRIKTKPKSGQLTPPSSISNRNSLIDELRNSGGRNSLRKTPKKETNLKKEEPLPAWIRSRDREKRSSFNPPPNSFETLEALLLAKDHQKSMPNLRTLSRANSDERKSPISPLASPTTPPSEEKTSIKKPKPPTKTNVAIAIKAALEAATAAPTPESSYTSSTEIIPHEGEGDETAVEATEADYDPHPSKDLLPITRALIPHRQLNPEYPEAPHGWQLLMWTIRKVGKFLKKHDENHHEKDWEVIHHKH